MVTCRRVNQNPVCGSYRSLILSFDRSLNPCIQDQFRKQVCHLSLWALVFTQIRKQNACEFGCLKGSALPSPLPLAGEVAAFAAGEGLPPLPCGLALSETLSRPLPRPTSPASGRGGKRCVDTNALWERSSRQARERVLAVSQQCARRPPPAADAATSPAARER